jgi:hypothetical protein
MPAPKKPQDHQAKAEAKGQDITLKFDGLDYSIDRGNADNVELMELVEDEKYISAIRGYLGVDQWVQFKDSHRDEAGRVPSEAFERFMTAAMEAIGGNSSASSPS